MRKVFIELTEHDYLEMVKRKGKKTWRWVLFRGLEMIEPEVTPATVQAMVEETVEAKLGRMKRGYG